MSYILDALKRAESERELERDRIPGLQAQSVALPDGTDADAWRDGPRRWWPASVLAVLVLVAAGWWWTAAAPGAAPAAITAGERTVPATVPAPPTPAPLPVLPPPAPLSASPVATNVPAATPAAVPAAAAAALAASAPPPPKPAPTQAPAAPSEPRPTPLAQLDPQRRAELPPMAIGGAIYSDSAASRFVVINGQVVREGDAAAPGVVLERIGPRAAVLRWRDLRIEVPY